MFVTLFASLKVSGEMKPVNVALLLLSVLMPLPAFAQFSIKDTPELEITLPDPKDEKIVIRPEYKWEYVNEALRREMKRQRRKERNYLEFTARFQLQQSSFDNWASGGDNNLNTTAYLDFKHVFKIDKIQLETTANAKYGLNYVDKEKFKNQDEFKINFKTSWNIHKNWSYSANANLRSQFAPGYKNREDKIKRSDFMSPGYLNLSAGITFRKGCITILASPVGGDARFVLDKEMSDLGWHGVEKGKRSKWQAGPSLKINLDKSFFKNVVRIKSEMYSFTNLQTNPNFRWETTISVKATKFLETTLNGELRYDELSKAEKAKSMQYRTAISFGLAYTLKNK